MKDASRRLHTPCAAHMKRISTASAPTIQSSDFGRGPAFMADYPTALGHGKQPPRAPPALTCGRRATRVGERVTGVKAIPEEAVMRRCPVVRRLLVPALLLAFPALGARVSSAG